MEKIWKICETNPRLQKIFSDSLGVSPLFAQILINRGIRNPEEAQEFLFGELSSCADPFLMKGVDRAVDRIKKAITKKEKILVYGDYDVDGLTSTALLADVLDELGAECETFIPNRLEDGYGLDVGAIERAYKRGVNLIVTVDCGVNSVEEVECANARGIDVIITDHHVVREDRRPEAYAIIDPQQQDCQYPFKYLAGVGVAYKLGQALMKGSEDYLDKHLDLVALGTIADIVPLYGENRILAKAGLKQLRNTEKFGLKALMEVARVDPDKLTCRHIGFSMGPRLNAMGRIGSADVALELLMCKEDDIARKLAQVLEKGNRDRQAVEKDILKQALCRVKEEVNLDKEKIIVLADTAWHPGVIGIVASRLTEEYRRPAILIALEDGSGKGSGRGIAGFHLLNAVTEAGVHLLGFGGHKQACGIRIEEENVDLFRQNINEVADKHMTGSEEQVPELKIDIKLPFSHIGVKLINELNILMPHSPDNIEPIFCTGGIKVKNTPRDIGRSGFKFLATCGNITCEVITFRKSQVARPRQGDIIDLAYTPSINSWSGIDSIQLNVKDLRVMG